MYETRGCKNSCVESKPLAICRKKLDGTLTRFSTYSGADLCIELVEQSELLVLHSLYLCPNRPIHRLRNDGSNVSMNYTSRLAHLDGVLQLFQSIQCLSKHTCIIYLYIFEFKRYFMVFYSQMCLYLFVRELKSAPQSLNSNP